MGMRTVLVAIFAIALTAGVSAQPTPSPAPPAPPTYSKPPSAVPMPPPLPDVGADPDLEPSPQALRLAELTRTAHAALLRRDNVCAMQGYRAVLCEFPDDPVAQVMVKRLTEG